MSHGWSPKDKSIAKTAVERARHRAEQEALRFYAEYKVRNIGDLWALELLIRGWRKERDYFCFNHAEANRQLALWLSKGWILLPDLQNMSQERLADILAIRI